MAFGAILGKVAGSVIGGLIGKKLGGGAGGGSVKVDEVTKIVSIGREDGAEGVHIAAFPCPKVNNTGLTGAWLALDIAAKAAAGLATVRAMQAARQQNKIARQYYDLAKRQWDFYNENYIPLEQQEIDEINRIKRYKPDYTATIKGHDCADNVFDGMASHRDKLLSEYCLCPDPDLSSQLELAKATVRGDTHNFARRYAEFNADKLDDIRWNRKLAIASRGRGLLPQSSEFASKAAGLFGQYSNAMGNFAGQAMQFSGYIRNRRNTVYNGNHTQRIESRWNERANIQTGMNYGASDIYTAHGYNPDYYMSNTNNGNSFYADASASLSSDGVLYDNIYSVQQGFGTGSVTGHLA